jgi:hypothetical protein
MIFNEGNKKYTHYLNNKKPLHFDFGSKVREKARYKKRAMERFSLNAQDIWERFQIFSSLLETDSLSADAISVFK